MKFDKKVMESGVVAAFSLALAFTAVPVNVPASADSDSQIVELTAEPKEDSNENVTKKKRESQVVATAATEKTGEVWKETREKKAEESAKAEEAKQAEAEVKEEQPEEAVKPEETAEVKEEQPEETAKLEEAQQPEEAVKPEEAEACAKPEEQIAETGTQEVSPWAEKLMPNVEEYLNIRTEASSEAELAGKLHKGAAADILEKGEEWTKISSGSVEGYVKNEFCVTGLEAEALANELGTTYATAVTGGVRVRETPSAEENVKILDVLEEEGKIKVNKEAEQIEGWVPVTVDDQTGYVSADYVNVELELGKAISVEEEQAMIAAEEAEKAAAQQSSGSQQKGAVAASYDEVTLLGALIQCEAGSEPYEGQLAVGAVVMNRLRAGYAGSISGVIYQSGQFTPASSGALASVLAGGVSGSCMSAAQEAINGVDNVCGAKSFRRAGSAQGIVIGNHVFF